MCKNSDANQVVHPARGAIDAVESRYYIQVLCQKANHPAHLADSLNSIRSKYHVPVKCVYYERAVTFWVDAC